MEVRKGTRDQANDYCKKNDTRIAGPWKIGNWNSGGRGKRSDLLKIQDLIKSNVNEKEIADEHFESWIKYYKAFREYKRLNCAIRNWMPEVYVIIGPTGTGKSKWAMENTTDGYWKQRSQWWDGYEGQEDVVIDEFYGWLPFDVLLRICDRYPLLVETKGGQTTFLAKRIIMTSNKLPDLWYPNMYFESFKRRVTKWKVMPFIGMCYNYDNYDEAKKHYLTIELLN